MTTTQLLSTSAQQVEDDDGPATLQGLFVNCITIAEHLRKCGRDTVGDKSYKFFYEGYVYGVKIYCQESNIHWTCTGFCHRSMKMNTQGHEMKTSFMKIGNVALLQAASCTCKVG